MTEVRPKQQRPQARARTRSIIVISGDYLGDFRKLSLYTNPSWLGRTKKKNSKTKSTDATPRCKTWHKNFVVSAWTLSGQSATFTHRNDRSRVGAETTTKSKRLKREREMLQPKASQSDSLSPIAGLPVACVDVERASNREGKRRGAHFLQGPPPVKKRHASLGSSITTLLHFYLFICN